MDKHLGSTWRHRTMATATASKTRLKLFPLADRVAIRPMEETETMKGGLYIPDTAKEKPIQGEVIAVGPGRREKGEVVPMELKVGDRVVYGKYSGTQVELEGDEIILIKESDDHQGRRHGRQGDRARGPRRKHGRPDGEGGGDQDLGRGGRRDHDGDGAGASDLPRGLEVRDRGCKPDVVEARHRQGSRSGG